MASQSRLDIHRQALAQLDALGLPQNSFTGNWVLTTDMQGEIYDQRPIMEAMGRSSWEISIINQADENFFLTHIESGIASGANNA